MQGSHHAFNVQQDRALDYLSTCIDQVHTFGDILQLVIVELIYKVSRCWYPCDFKFTPQQLAVLPGLLPDRVSYLLGLPRQPF